MTVKTTRLIPALSLCTSLLIASCTPTTNAGNPIDRLAGDYSLKQDRTATAAYAAMAAGKTDEALAQYKKLYKKNKTNKDIALNYAQLLRRSGDAKTAVAVMKPFSENTDPLVQTEYAACLIANGDFEQAETTLKSVLENKDAETLHTDAVNLMGVTLDAQGKHAEAEKMLRIALENWKGNRTSVMNNLALVLAHRGVFDESLNLLRQAQIMDPNNERITRNIQVVTDLRTSIVPKAPVKISK